MLGRRHHGQDDGTERGPSSSGNDSGESLGDGLVTPSVAATGSAQPAPSTSLSSSPAVSSNSGVSTLQFSDMQNATTCQSYRVSWSYTGPNPDSDIILSINQDPTGSKNDTMPLYLPLIPIRTLSSNISSTATDFIWGSVDLEQGSYMLNARAVNPNESAKFVCRPTRLYVVNGTDTDCIKYPESAISSESRPRLSKGDIAGIIIGAIAAGGLLAVAFIFPRLWRRDLPSPKRRRPYYLY